MSDAVLVVGGGISGLRAALDLSHAGARVILTEPKATLGGRLASVMEEGAAALDLPRPGMMPSLNAVMGSAHVEILTLCDVVGLDGEPGEFTATIRQRARFVSDVCDRCGVCRQVCPVVRPNEYDAGLTFRKAIFSPLRNPAPHQYVVDIESCLNAPPNYLPCQRCVQNCHVRAIRFDVPLEKTFTRDVAAVVLAAGYDVSEPGGLARYGYGAHPDVVTSLELERLFAPSGATGGYVEKPSNEQDPERVLFVVRDDTDFTWMYTGRQAARLLDQAIGDVTIIFEHAPKSGREPASFLSAAAREKTHLVAGSVLEVNPASDGVLEVRYRDAADGGEINGEFDLVVLATGVRPSATLPDTSAALGVRLGSDGFVRVMDKDGRHVATSRPGVYACGCVTGPKNIAESLLDAGAATEQALTHLKRRFRVSTHGDGASVSKDGISEAELRTRVEQVLEQLISLGERKA